MKLSSIHQGCDEYLNLLATQKTSTQMSQGAILPTTMILNFAEFRTKNGDWNTVWRNHGEKENFTNTSIPSKLADPKKIKYFESIYQGMVICHGC